MKRILRACVLFLLVSTALGLGFGNFKKIRLEDIESDNLKSKQPQQQDQKPQQQQQKQQSQQQKQPAQPQQAQAQPAQEQKQPQEQQQQPPSAPEYSAQPEQQPLSLNHEQQQLFLHQLQGYQPQYQSPQAFLHAGFLGGNNLGIHPDLLSFLAPQHNTPAYHQQFYFPHNGYSGLQFLPQSPVFYNQQIPQEQPEVQQNSAPQSAAASSVPEVPAKEIPSVPTAAASQQSSQPAEKPQKVDKQPETAQQPQAPQIPAEPNFEFTQQNFNPIPKELESYTTIPESIYQGKEPDFLYEQQIPDVSLTNEHFNPYNALYHQSSQLQRPIFSSGIKSDSSSLKSFPNSGSFFTRNSFLGANSRHFPSESISYTTYRQGGLSPF